MLVMQVDECPFCDGEGTVRNPTSIVDKVCTVCDGEGVVWFEDNEIVEEGEYDEGTFSEEIRLLEDEQD